MGNKVYVVGVGMTKFEKPGSKEWDYPDMAEQAGTRALEDAGIAYDLVEQAAVGYCYGDSTCGQRAVYTLGLTGIPIYNVNNNCATGSTALFMGKQFVEAGIADCVLALGFEKMEKGSLGTHFTDRTNPMDKHAKAMIEKRGFEKAPPAPQFFGNAGREHMEKYGTKPEHFAKIGWKNHKHSVNNPYSQFQDEYSLEDIQNAPTVYEPLTKLQCCPTSDGAGAAVLASEAFVRQHGLQAKAVEIAGMTMATDTLSSFDDKSDMKLVGYDMTRDAARKVYEQSGKGPRTSTWSSCTTASRPTSSSPTKRWVSAPRARPATSSIRAPRPTAARSWSTPRAGSSRKATHSAQPASPNARSSTGRSAARQMRARWTA